jgi:hypothetical protein
MSNDRGMQMAMILRGLHQLDMELANYETDWKARRTELENALDKLGGEILSGQMTISEVFEKVANEVNSGALDTKDVKVTAEVKHATPVER